MVFKTGRKEKNRNVAGKVRRSKHKLYVQMKNDWMLYMMLIPVLAWYIIFCYGPMGGLILAFKDYSYSGGIWGSEWIGLANFRQMFADRDLFPAIRNTLILGIGGVLMGMPCEIGLALMLNELRMPRAKKIIQTTVTFPHFISWVVLAGIMKNIFASTGVVNQILQTIGFDTIAPLTSASSYRWFIWLSGIWKEVGWGSIIYLAAITSVDQGLYEAAHIDGASRLQQIWHVTLPCIRSTICIMLILAIGNLISNGRFDQIFNTYSSPVYSVADTIDTYIYRESFGSSMDFGYSTAIGMAKSVVSLILIVTANKVVTAAGEQGLL